MLQHIEQRFLKDDKGTNWNYTYGNFEKIVRDVIKNLNELVLVEIGVARGGHSEHVMKNFGHCIKKMSGIDPYRANYDSNDDLCNDYPTQELFDAMYNYAKNKMNKYEKYDFIRESSSTAIKNFKNKSIDAIYIDGSHEEEDVLFDIKNWWKKLKINGVMILDDYYYHEGVTKAVTRFSTNNIIKINFYIDKVYFIKL